MKKLLIAATVLGLSSTAALAQANPNAPQPGSTGAGINQPATSSTGQALDRPDTMTKGSASGTSGMSGSHTKSHGSSKDGMKK